MEDLLILLKPLIELYAGKSGTLVQVILFIGSLRILIKPLMSLLEAYVTVSGSSRDDKLPSQIKEKKWYKTLVYLLDWFGSIKVK